MSIVIHRSRIPRPNIWHHFLASEQTILIVLVVGALAVHCYQLANFNINWDEFFYLSQVHEYRQGDLELRLQTFHVHFFGWLPSISDNEVDQIIAARAVMFGLQILTAWLLYRLARRLTAAPAAFLAVAGYLSLSFVIRGGTSFRTDPIATCLVMATFDLLLTRAESIWRAALAGLLLALAAIITIKTAMFLPSLVVVVAVPLLCGGMTTRAARRTVATALTAVVGFTFLYALHTLTLNEGIARPSTDLAMGSLSKTVITAGFFPQLDTLILTLRWDLVFWALWLVGGGVLARRIWQANGSERSRWLEAGALTLPVASLAVYRNSFPYFYPFILAPASVLTALAWQSLAAGRALPTVLKLLALTWFVASLILHGIYAPILMPLEHQRTVLAAIHRAFPTPTPYLDRSSMVASFPQVGFFMSTWGMEVYVERGEPVLRQAIEQHQPPLLVANHPLLDIANAVYPASLLSHPQLLAADREALAGAYIHHWGPIYVAGKRFKAPHGAAPTRIDLLIAGRYTLEAISPVRIDGKVVHSWESVDLARGAHLVAATAASELVTLRWGETLYRPEYPAPDRPLFLGF